MNLKELSAFKADLWTISRSEQSRLVVRSVHPSSNGMTEIRRLRLNEYQNRGATYLCSTDDESIAKNHELDQRSLHLSVWRSSQLIGAIRLTEMPFELLTEMGVPPMADIYAGHMEFGRLVMTADAGFRTAAEKLMALGCLRALDLGKAGVIAMCRPAQTRLFERYGLVRIMDAPLILPHRNNGKYWLLASSWQSMAAPIERIAAQIRQQKIFSEKESLLAI